MGAPFICVQKIAARLCEATSAIVVASDGAGSCGETNGTRPRWLRRPSWWLRMELDRVGRPTGRGHVGYVGHRGGFGWSWIVWGGPRDEATLGTVAIGGASE